MSFLVDSFACGAEHVLLDLLHGLQSAQLVRASFMATGSPRFPRRPRGWREESLQRQRRAGSPCNYIRSPFLRSHNSGFCHHLLCNGVRFHNVLRPTCIKVSAKLCALGVCFALT